jgi:hypothetical protein
MLVAVRFSGEMLQKYIEEGMVNEIDTYEEKLATLKLYEGKRHYFFSITPKEIFFIRHNNITVVIGNKDGYVSDLSAIAYKMFLVSLIKDRFEGGIARKSRIIWSDEIEQKINKEIYASNRFRTRGQSMYYPEEDYYEFSILY